MKRSLNRWLLRTSAAVAFICEAYSGRNFCSALDVLPDYLWSLKASCELTRQLVAFLRSGDTSTGTSSEEFCNCFCTKLTSPGVGTPSDSGAICSKGEFDIVDTPLGVGSFEVIFCSAAGRFLFFPRADCDCRIIEGVTLLLPCYFGLITDN